MEAVEKKLSVVIDRVKETLGDGAEPERLARHRRQFVLLAAHEQSPPFKNRVTRRRLAVATMLIVGTLGIVAGVWVGMRPANLEFYVGNGRMPGTANQWVESSDNKDLPVRFDGGTRLVLAPRTTAKIERADNASVRIQLAAGQLTADVHRNEKTRWVIAAGPYAVEVLGTQFSVKWDPTQKSFNVNVARGVVWVRGKGIDAEGVHLARGYQLSGRDGHISVSGENRFGETSEVEASPVETTEEGEPLIENPVETDPGEESVVNRKTTTASPSKRSESGVGNGRPVAPSWRELYSKKEYRGAVIAAEQVGIPFLMKELDETALWQLMDAARNSGDAELSILLLKGFRDRFPESAKARIAAFLIGKISVDDKRAAASAAAWFETYLKESPDGPLAEEALGRLVLVYQSLGKIDAARRYAADYTAMYRKGSFLDVSRAVLENTGSTE